MILTLDASAAMEIALGTPGSQRFHEWLVDADLVLAPDIFPSEITNTFWKLARARHLTVEQCEAAMEGVLDLVDDLVPTRALCREVFMESQRLKHPCYDLYYLAVARRNNAMILTRDQKLKKLAEAVGVKTG